jgi:hypothetical protein
MKAHSLLKWCAISTTAIHSAFAQSAQELIDSVLNSDPSKATYSSYSSEIYLNRSLYNTTPIASTNYDRLEASAKLRLPVAAYNYAAGGAGLEKTVAANLEAFDKVSKASRLHLKVSSQIQPVAHCPPHNAGRTPFSQPIYHPLRPHNPRPHRHGPRRRTNDVPSGRRACDF